MGSFECNKHICLKKIPKVPKISCIYKIENTKNRKFYVGSCVNFENRKAVHLYELQNNKHRNKHLQRAFLKYGESAFVFSILEVVDSVELLIEREQFYLDSLRSYERKIGYNILKTAGSWLGHKHSEKTKKKLSKKLQGYKHTTETREKMRQNSPMLSGKLHPKFGKKHSVESVKKMKESSPHISGESHPMFGKKWDESHLGIFSEKSAGSKNPMYGVAVFDLWKKKYGEQDAIRKWGESNIKRSKGMIQKNSDGIVLAEYNSLTEAREKTGVSISAISRYCKGDRVKAGGFHWEYKIINQTRCQ